MNLEEEYNKIKEHIKVEWFKPTIGKYEVVIIGEPTPEEYINESDGKVTQQIVLDVEINKKRRKWSISKGLTFASLFGQIMALAKYNNYSTNGLKLTLLVKNDGYKNDYTILEAMELPEANTK